MELLLVLLALGALLAIIGVPVGLAVALSRGRAAQNRIELLSHRVLEVEEDLRQLRTRFLHASPAPKKAAAPAPPEPEPSASAAPAEPPAEDHPAVASTTDTPPGAMPDLLARIREQRQANRESANKSEHADPAHGSTQDAKQATPPTKDEPVTNQPPAVAVKRAPAKVAINFEELLAGKVFIWIGAIALVLTGAFLLKYGFDNNIIDERVRVIGAGIFGLVLIGGGEFMRRKMALIAQSLSGAGVATLFGTVLAGSTLYGLIGPCAAFAMMVVITAGAVVLSLRHGSLVALLGMVGGFTLPPLLGQPLDAQPGMIVYLIALEMGVLAVTRKRGWMGISALTLLFSMAWSLGYTLIGDSQADRLLTGMLVLATTVVFVLNTAWSHHRSDDKPSRLKPLWLSLGAAAAGAALLGLLVNQDGYAMSDLGMLALLALGTMVLAKIDKRYRMLTWVVAGLCAVVLGSWAIRVQQFMDTTDLGMLAGVTAGFGLLFTLGGYACCWTGEPSGRRHFARFAAVCGPVFLALVTFAGSEALGWREAWWYWTLSVAGMYILFAAGLLRRGLSEDRWSAQWFVTVSAGLIFVGIGQMVDHPWPAVGWSLLAAGCAYAGWQLKMPALRYVSVGALSISAAVLLGLPGPYAVDAAGVVVFNTFLPMYGLPIVACLMIARWARAAGWGELVELARALAVILAGALAIVLVRDGFRGPDFNTLTLGLYERGTYGIVLLAIAYAMLMWARYRGSLFARQAGRFMAVAALAVAGFTTLLIGNPLLDGSVAAGGELIGALFYLYLLPATAMYAFATLSDPRDQHRIERALRIGGVTLAACFLGLQVRNAFHFENLHALHIGVFEWATYGVGWMAMGLGLYIIGKRLPAHAQLTQAGLVVGLLGLGTTVFGNFLVANPLWTRESVGLPIIFNGLWYLYGPAILALAVLANRLRKHGRADQAMVAGSAAIAIGFLLVCLLVRQGFSDDGVLVIGKRPGSAEWYTYSLAWVLLAIGLLVGGIFTKLNTLRYGSLAVMLLAVGKVFALDTAQLADLYRVFSFLGLGITLLVLGYVYQRFVFGRPGLLPRTRNHDEAPNP